MSVIPLLPDRLHNNHLGNRKSDQINQWLCLENTNTVRSPPHPPLKKVKRVRKWKIVQLEHGGTVPFFFKYCFYGIRLMGSKTSILNLTVESTINNNKVCFKWIQKELKHTKISLQWYFTSDYPAPEQKLQWPPHKYIGEGQWWSQPDIYHT